MNKYITCPICNKQFEQITNSHLKTHNLTTDEFRNKYPQCSLKSDFVKQIEINHLSAGRKLASKFHTNERLDREKKYYENPKLCLKCGQPIEYKYRNNTFCGSSCAAKYNNIRKVYKKTYSTKHKTDRGVYRVYTTTHICQGCNKEFVSNKATRRKFCTRQCQTRFQQNQAKENYLKKLSLGEHVCKTTIRRLVMEKHNNTCQECGQKDIWNNKPLSLQVHHIDGNSDNNNLDNLLLLCPNCHSQTDTWGRNNTRPDNSRKQYYLKQKTKIGD